MKRLNEIIYNVGIALYFFAVKIAAYFGNNKAKLFVQGRKGVMRYLTQCIGDSSKKRIWFHISSLGEYEQARPLIEAIKLKHINATIIISFFSPSGYEIVKKRNQDDIIFYLPQDTSDNAKELLSIIRPELLLFVKYDLWYHLINEASKQHVKMVLFSAVFRAEQVYFKRHGALHRAMLQMMDYIFVQDVMSQEALNELGIQSIIAGDTRIDSVYLNTFSSKEIESIKEFKGEENLLILGSAWDAELSILSDIIPNVLQSYKILIAPHDISDEMIMNIKNQFKSYNPIRYTEASTMHSSRIMILDTIGILKYAYQYGTVAMVGGGFKKSGIHSILEPAAYGLPILFGPRHHRFSEAQALIDNGGALVIEKPVDTINYLQDVNLLKSMGAATALFIKENVGATSRILSYL